jgi:hypothetical protein
LRARTVAGATGLIVLVPALLWAWSLRRWPNDSRTAAIPIERPRETAGGSPGSVVE